MESKGMRTVKDASFSSCRTRGAGGPASHNIISISVIIFCPNRMHLPRSPALISHRKLSHKERRVVAFRQDLSCNNGSKKAASSFCCASAVLQLRSHTREKRRCGKRRRVKPVIVFNRPESVCASLQTRWPCARARLTRPQPSWWTRRWKRWTPAKGSHPRPSRTTSSRNIPRWTWRGWNIWSAELWKKDSSLELWCVPPTPASSPRARRGSSG